MAFLRENEAETGQRTEHEAIDGFVREISTREELEELIERMPYIQTIQAPNSKARKELYQLAMDEYDDVNQVKVIKSVYLRMEDHRYDEFEQMNFSNIEVRNNNHISSSGNSQLLL